MGCEYCIYKDSGSTHNMYKPVFKTVLFSCIWFVHGVYTVVLIDFVISVPLF